ncbi:MAG: archaeosine biosynthesis radical SAM protein RaSEA [Candidatus Heimdallarchaeota archaeon]|nr:archaeosine biosynthesis radical SAM protein RaSEA [Candidatus Heimdallarchaeota archaeon]MCK5048495.1 archaeosine biosynthesis radical SAM protein RaSEA [Candidatus Heimdallarchaeota archaeon]
MFHESSNYIITDEMKTIREKELKFRRKYRPVKKWIESCRLLNGRTSKALVFILPTRGCSWALKDGGCTMCGYIYDNPVEPTLDELKSMISQVKKIIMEKRQEDDFEVVKLFTSGSYLDIEEIPIEIQKELLEFISQVPGIDEITIESRPEYVTPEALDMLDEVSQKVHIEIAIGLESASDQVREQSINKGFSWSDYLSAITRINNSYCTSKAYLLLKPPLLSENAAINDVVDSVDKLSELNVESISLNPMNVQRGTWIHREFERYNYRTPWLWSVVFLLRKMAATVPNTRIICDPTAGGRDRGAHNCGKCDKEILNLISEFSLTQDPSVFDKAPKCDCLNEWNAERMTGAFKINQGS